MIPARRPASLVVLLLALAGLLLAACGSSDKPSSAQDILKDTFGPGKSIKSGRLDMGIGLDAVGLQGVDGPVRLTLKGPFASQGGQKLPKFAFDLGLTAGGTTFAAGATSTGDAGYLKFQGTSYKLSKSVFESFKTGYEASAKDSGKKGSQTSLSKLGVDPLKWLDNPRKAGTAEVGGAETNHVTATVDVPSMLADVDTLLRKAGTLGGQAAANPQGPDGGPAHADHERGQERDVRRLRRQGRRGPAQARRQGRLRRRQGRPGRRGGPAARHLSAHADDRRPQRGPGDRRPGVLQAAVGAAGADPEPARRGDRRAREPGSGTAPAPSAGGTATTPAAPGAGATGAAPSAANQSAYVQCLTAAGADIAKVNACAKLLNK